MPNALRSLLFGGMDPSTIVGLELFSAVPCPKLSSPEPVALSFLTSPGRNEVPVPPVSQSMQPDVLTIRLALVSISNALPARVAGFGQAVVVADAELANVKATTSADAISVNTVKACRNCSSAYCGWTGHLLV